MDNVEELVLVVHGKDLEDAFANLPDKFFSILLAEHEIKPQVTKSVMIRSNDIKSLLYKYTKKIHDFAINDALFLNKVNGIKIEILNNEYLLTANLIGEKVNRNHKIKNMIKHVTNRNIIIKEDRNGCTLQINIIIERKNEV
ncbi:MAG TPA: archease [Candidatus Nanoarchaeia archaeon]|nr:archease [Candidatus Nanoarchaeia archaeon]